MNTMNELEDTREFTAEELAELRRRLGAVRTAGTPQTAQTAGWKSCPRGVTQPSRSPGWSGR